MELRRRALRAGKRVARQVLDRPELDPDSLYALSDPHLLPRVQSAIATVRPHSMVAYSGLGSLYEQVRHCERAGIEGAFVECGVWHGGAAALMAIANLAEGPVRRQLHLFDSFVGIPEPIDGIDGERALSDAKGRSKSAAGGELKVAWDYAERGGPGSAAQVSSLLESVGYDVDQVRFHVGWFQETVPAFAPTIGPIALLRLDGDWYESTKVCLDHLYRYVVPGGFVIVDDYGAYAGCRRAVDEFMDSLQERPFISRVNSEIRYLVMPG